MQLIAVHEIDLAPSTAEVLASACQFPAEVELRSSPEVPPRPSPYAPQANVLHPTAATSAIAFEIVGTTVSLQEPP